jgi:hypothetical protein
MPQKHLYQHIQDQIDFAETILGGINAGSINKQRYFMTLVYIEDILDGYGRDVIAEDGRASGMPEDELTELKHRANAVMDRIRHQLRTDIQTEGYADEVVRKSQEMMQTWRKWDESES